MPERTPKIFSGELRAIRGSDHLIVGQDVEITGVVAAYGRILFMLDANGRVVGAAIRNASRGIDKETYWKPQYNSWESKKKNE